MLCYPPTYLPCIEYIDVYYVSGTVLTIGYIAVNKANKNPCPGETYTLVRHVLGFSLFVCLFGCFFGGGGRYLLVFHSHG